MPETLENLIEAYVRREINLEELIVGVRQNRKTWIAFGFLAGIVSALLITGLF